MFLRTVKLKDFPWNGWLQLGIATQPESAWNPVGGFNDPLGRLAWYALSDPAAIPSPYEAAWTFNRISDVEAISNADDFTAYAPAKTEETATLFPTSADRARLEPRLAALDLTQELIPRVAAARHRWR